jgi:hypothetical protein
LKLSDLRGPSPVYALSAAPAPPFIVGGIPPPNFAQISVVETIFESFELATENSPESEYGTVESETLAPEPFVPENWIKQFDHNATHVNIASGNETFNLLWTYELVIHLQTKTNDSPFHSLLRLLFLTIV